jgi:hypothetical protein
MSLVQSQSSGAPYVNGGNVHGGAFVTDTMGAVANGGNTAYGGSTTSSSAMKGDGMYSVTGIGGSPSSTQVPFPASNAQKGGGRRRRRSKTSRRSRKNRRHSRFRSRKYGGRKRVTKSRSRSRSRRGGYAQYMTNVASAFGQSIPGFPLTSRMSALANPPPFRPYQNCPGGL